MEEFKPGSTYEELRDGMRWRLPATLNIGTVCVDRHPPHLPALIEFRDGTERTYAFGELARLSNRFAHGLRSLGVLPGDRVGIVLPQRVETGLAHLAVYKLGAIAVPLSGLFGPDALRYRLTDAEPRAVVTDAAHVESIAEAAAEIDDLAIVVVDGAKAPHHDFWSLVEQGSDELETVETTPDTPALLIYTSGTTGQPKGALHGHRTLIGHLPGFVLSHDLFPQEDDRFWTPADWAWIGGLMDALLPTWYHGRPVVAAAREKFDPAWALNILAKGRVRNAFVPPTALRILRSEDTSSTTLPRLRTVMSGGEALGEDVLDWARERLGVTINEIYGQTEANYVIGNSARLWDVRPGSMGRAYPGHDVTVLGADGGPVADGEIGEIAVRAPDPVVFLEYWRSPEATRAKYTASGDWLLTGDEARRDADGYFWFHARNDDVINSAGYRIGPTEIESCLMQHRFVALAAVVGVPDAIRGESVKAFVQLTDGCVPTAELESEIRLLVRDRLAAYVYPRQIEFVAALPLTTTGKVRRAELRKAATAQPRDSGG